MTVFSIGDKVMLSDKGIENHICPGQDRNRIATVIGYSRDRDCVRIQWEGAKYAMIIHDTYLDFLEPFKRRRLT